MMFVFDLDASPICPVLLPEVTALFQQHVDIRLLGIKEKPTLTEAFDILIDKKTELLKTMRSASTIFAYFDELSGENCMLIERLSELAFIPLEDLLCVFLDTTSSICVISMFRSRFTRQT